MVQATLTTGMLLMHLGSYGNHYTSIYAHGDSQVCVLHESEFLDDRAQQLTTT